MPIRRPPDNRLVVISAARTYLTDAEGNLWPILARETAYERATKYAETEQIFGQRASGGCLGATHPKAIAPQTLAYGILFFPGEVRSAKQLRLQVKAGDTGAVHVLTLNL